jgi:glycosyltransferase involved in cell wall biosynthesis
MLNNKSYESNKINILHISPQFNFACGVSKHVFTIINSEELKNRFNFHYLTNGGDAIVKLKRAGIKYSYLNFKTDKQINLEFLKNYISLKEYCKKHKINIIHSHHRYPTVLAQLVAKSLNINTVVTAHNFVTGFRRLSYKADYVIAVSHAVKNHLCSYFNLCEEKVKVLYNCIKSETYSGSPDLSLKKSLKIPKASKVILFAGRITKEKGIEFLIKAFNQVSSKYNQVELILLGEINLHSKILLQLKNYERIQIIPQEENPDKYFKISDVVVLPSIKEPLGYTMLEAGLFKILFIGSNAGGIAEFIEDGINGYLFDSGDVEGLAEKIQFVLEHPVEAQETAKKLHKKVLDLCNCEKYYNELSHVYYSLVR